MYIFIVYVTLYIRWNWSRGPEYLIELRGLCSKLSSGKGGQLASLYGHVIVIDPGNVNQFFPRFPAPLICVISDTWRDRGGQYQDIPVPWVWQRWGWRLCGNEQRSQGQLNLDYLMENIKLGRRDHLWSRLLPYRSSSGQIWVAISTLTDPNEL